MAASRVTTWTLTDGSTVSINASIPDAQAGQIVAYLMQTMPQQNDDMGAPIPRTPQNLIRQWEQGNIAANIAIVDGWIAAQAAAAASAASVPIAVILT